MHPGDWYGSIASPSEGKMLILQVKREIVFRLFLSEEGQMPAPGGHLSRAAQALESCGRILTNSFQWRI